VGSPLAGPPQLGAPAPPPGVGGAQGLDRPPPSPEVPPGAPGSQQPLMGGPEGAEGQNGVSTLVRMSAGLDGLLLNMARALPAGAREFGQCRELLKRGVAKALSAIGQTPATSPTSAGQQFPGGGFSGPG